MSASTYDVIVIGSGFGGAVTACRLAERGQRVLVLERGRRWEVGDFPRGVSPNWVWDHFQPHRFNGWLDLRFFRGMAVAQGAGVGGGSLVYANVSVEAGKEAFDDGWPPEITAEELAPYYDRVGRMLNVQTIPENQATERFKLAREAAEALGHGARFRALPLATTFDPEWNWGLDDPTNPKHSKTWVNAQGQTQGTCIHCGNCCIGCQVRAKNTLDLNYIPWAERHGAEVRSLHLVTRIEPDGHGYRVGYDRLEKGKRLPGSVTGRRVILAAGSLGSTELLLRARNQHRTLPQVSRALGRGWSSNGDFLTPSFYNGRRVSPTRGPTISCAIDFLDGSEGGSRFFIEDGGWPDLLAAQFANVLRIPVESKRWQIVLGALGQLARTCDPQKNIMPWFAQGVDAADGMLYLGRALGAPWKRELKLRWRIGPSRKVIQAIVAMHKRLAEATGGKAHVPEAWSLFQSLITPHPLGGCRMGVSPEDGVVDHRGEVFGHPGLFVADGAIIPRAIGLNPSRTIAALAERIAEVMED
jgi:cholesterol oxidase